DHAHGAHPGDPHRRRARHLRPRRSRAFRRSEGSGAAALGEARGAACHARTEPLGAAAMKRFPPLDLGKVRTYPLGTRPSKVAATALGKAPRAGASFADFLDGLPAILAARDLRAIAAEIAARHGRDRTIVLGMGAHPIKVGLSPLIVDLMQRGILH